MMQIWAMRRSHPVASGVVLAMWVAAWALTIALWQYAPDGGSVGMPPLTTALHFALPLVIAALMGWWRKGSGASLAASIASAAIAGLLFSLLNFVLLLVWSGVLIGLGRARPDPSEPLWGGIFEALSMGLAYAITLLILGAVGGLIGAAALTATRRLRGPR